MRGSHRCTLVVVSVVSAGLGSACAGWPVSEDDRTANKIANIFRRAHAADQFHGTVLVAEGDRQVYAGSFGFADREQKRPIDASTVFPLASVTKPIVAIAILLLRDDGAMALDDPVVRHLAGFPYPSVTIRHLLQHTSGLRDNFGTFLAGWDKTRIAANRDIIDDLYRTKPRLASPPRDTFEYSNLGYMLLAELIAAVANQSYRDVLRERIFEPATVRV